MKTMLLSLLALLSVTGSSDQSGICRILPGKVPFENKKFDGDWFTLARNYVAIAPQKNAVCWKNYVRSNDTHMEIQIRSKYNDGSSKLFDVEGHFTNITSYGAVLTSYFDLAKGQKYRGPATEAIIATDYKNFALHYFCMKVGQHDRVIAAEVWSRKPAMDPEELEALKSVVSSWNFLNTANITNIDQSGCD